MDCSKCVHKFREKVKWEDLPKKKVKKNYVSVSRFPPKEDNPHVSQRRLDNFLKAFSRFQWDEKSLEMTVIGYGDRPAFQIDGSITTIDGIKIKVRWHSFTPGGGQARLYYWVKEKRYRIYAPQSIAQSVALQVVYDYTRRMMELPNKKT